MEGRICFRSFFTLLAGLEEKEPRITRIFFAMLKRWDDHELHELHVWVLAMLER